MNRPISFRAWHSGRKVWLHDKSYGGCHILGETIWAFGEWCRVPIEELNDVIVTQFTGLKDSKGVDIFEGDIVRHWVAVEHGGQDAHWDIDPIIWDDKWARFSLGESHDLMDCDVHPHTFEVIGNIFENPEIAK